jgi:hypothetical protein
MGEWRSSSTILNLGDRWNVSGQVHALVALSPGYSTWYPLDNKSLAPVGNRPACNLSRYAQTDVGRKFVSTGVGLT